MTNISYEYFITSNSQANDLNLNKRAVSSGLVWISWATSLALSLPPLFGWGGIAPEPNGLW